MVKYINQSESEVFAELLKTEASEQKQYYNIEACEDKTGTELIEKAHPESGETIESYNTNGGVVENDARAQEIGIEVATRTPNATVHRRKIATDELLNELKIIAEEMSIREQNDIVRYSEALSSEIKKKAVPWLAIGFLSTAIVSAVSAWWLTAYSTSSSTVNTGIDANLNKIISAISKYNQITSGQLSGEQGSSIRDSLDQYSMSLSQIKNSRDEYLNRSKELARKLTQITGMDSNKQPTAKDIKKSINVNTGSNEKTEEGNANLKPEAKAIIEQINKYNQIYNNWVTKTIIPFLTKRHNYFSIYFAGTEKIESVNEPGAWEKIKSVFTAENDPVAQGKIIIRASEALIASFTADIKLREIEAKDQIENLSKKIETDLTKELDAATPDKNIILPTEQDKTSITNPSYK